jgi:hypothetical protein
MRVFVDGVGLLGPGLVGWEPCREILAGRKPVQPDTVTLPPITLLPPAERRRTGAAVKLAIAVGLEALAQAGRAASDMATVFTSSGGDGDTIDAILTVLSTEQREISPTRFHNSVHNAPSGYWALACAATAPSTSLCGFDGSFAIGLLDAAAQCTVDRRPVTLISYDLPYPSPLQMLRPITISFATALVLTPERSERSLAELNIRLQHGNAAGSVMADPGLEAQRRANPAARSLPLLQALASGGGRVSIEGIAHAVAQIEIRRLGEMAA